MRYYVAPNGVNFNTNPWGTPGYVPGDLVTTVAQILANPSPGGDEIWAAGDNNVLGAAYQGTYNLASPLVINNNSEPLSIYGSFAGTEQFLCERNANIVTPPTAVTPNYFQFPSILDGGNANRVIYMPNAYVCHIDGFIIQNGDAGTFGSGGGVFVVDSNNIWFENIVCLNNMTGFSGGGMLLQKTPNIMVKNSIFFNNTANNATIGGGGLCVNDCSHVKVVNLLCNANVGNGAAMYIMNANNVEIINNTISGNTVASIGSSHVYCLNSNVNIYNSILYPDTLAAAGGTITVDYCLLNQTNFPLLSNIIPPNNNPNFVNGFHLQATSPCIDTGYTNYIFPCSATDLEGRPRFINGGNPPPPPRSTMEVDMGAFEWR